MVKCDYCDNVYYGNEKKCTSCGARLTPVPDPVANNTITTTPPTKFSFKKSKFFVVYIIFLIIYLVTSAIFRESSAPIVTTQSADVDQTTNIEPTTTVETNNPKYTENDLNSFETYNQRFTANHADKEAVTYLVWYYLYNAEPIKAYDVTDKFFQQEVKDDREIYIEISDIYIDRGVYGYALYTLNKGYELTKLESIKNYADTLTLENLLQDQQIKEMVTLMFGKNLSLIRYEDLSQVKSIIVDVTGREILYSTEEPQLNNGYIENFDDYKGKMKSIQLEQSIKGSREIDLFVNLKVFVDESSGVASNDWLPYISNLYYLELKPREDLESVAVIPNLKGLTLNYSNVKAIKDIEKLSQLEFLRLEDTEVFDITNVSKLENLKTLSLEDNENILNVEPILNISTLKNLEIIDMDIVSLNINTDVMALERLIIDDTDIKNVDFVANCTSLKELAIVGNRELKDIPSLGNLTNIEVLQVQTTQKGTNFVYTVDFIKGLTSVKKLTIKGNLHDVTAVGTMTGVEELALNIGVIDANLSPLSSLTNLKKLWFEGRPMNNVNDVSFLSSLKNLTYLELGNCGYVKGNSIWQLENLEVLHLNNFVGNFGNISNLKNLKELYLGELTITTGVYAETSGAFTSIYTDGKINLTNYSSQLSSLTNLEILDISKTEVDNIDFVRNFSKLVKINIDDNYITDLEPLSNLENLEYVSVIKNPISNWAGLREKSGLKLVIQDE